MSRERRGHTVQKTTAIVNTAEALGVSPGTVMRDWTLAKAWLRLEIGDEDQDES